MLVTGATGGLGRKICARFAEDAWRVVVGYRSDRDAAEKLAADLGYRAFALHCTVDDSAALARAHHIVAAAAGSLDCLINNAGMTRFVPHSDLEALDDDLFDKIFRTNVRGAFAAVRAMTPLLRKGHEPSIINISSIAAVTGMGSNVAYCASKAALDSMTRSLGRALAPDIRVISVSPGVVDTDFIKGVDLNWRERQQHATPLLRFANAEEVAQACFVAATALTFTTGSVIPLDGGRPLGTG